MASALPARPGPSFPERPKSSLECVLLRGNEASDLMPFDFSSNCAYLDATLRQRGIKRQCTAAQLEVKRVSTAKPLIAKGMELLSTVGGGQIMAIIEVMTPPFPATCPDTRC